MNTKLRDNIAVWAIIIAALAIGILAIVFIVQVTIAAMVIFGLIELKKRYFPTVIYEAGRLYAKWRASPLFKSSLVGIAAIGLIVVVSVANSRPRYKPSSLSVPSSSYGQTVPQRSSYTPYAKPPVQQQPSYSYGAATALPPLPAIPSLPKLPKLPSIESASGYALPYYGTEFVNGHVRNGRYVPGYYRTGGDETTRNNWSTKGNTNPLTGKRGSKQP